MSKLRPIHVQGGEGDPFDDKGIRRALYGYRFECPGCASDPRLAPFKYDRSHSIPTTGDKAWGFNGNVDKPTFTPSILVHPHGARDDKNEVFQTPRCHSFVTDGRIQFLGDCTHALAGQTVDLPEIES